MVSFVPQALKILRTRDVKAISTAMYTVTVTGFALWTAFGIFRGELPIIITNTVCFLLSAFILAMKLMPARVREKLSRQVGRS